ncbi:MAG: orotidine-5'-phosphate decarboxylase [Deltaproteobacteria bacterium]|nr:orotidine-5'-phosphate decarboxylase [Deltaproteobacteria bacterium]
MQPKDRIFVALDVPNLPRALGIVAAVQDQIGGVKVGLELLTSVGAPTVVEAMSASGLPIFFDAKFCDMPNTVAGAVEAATRLGVAMMTVHALGGIPMLEAAVAAADRAALLGPRPKILAVTILTSLTWEALGQLRVAPLASEEALQEYVVHLACMAQQAGCHGVVASPHEVAAIRAACGPDLTIVTPGVRPAWSVRGDQQRFSSPRDACEAGADYLVIGRPITQPPPEIGTPAAAVARIVGELA